LSSDGGECDFCGQRSFMPYRCRYCNGRFCPDHRLPENHACEGLRRPLAKTTWEDYSAHVRRRRAAEAPRIWERWDREEESGRWAGPAWPPVTTRFRDHASDQVQSARRMLVGAIISALIIGLLLRFVILKG